MKHKIAKLLYISLTRPLVLLMLIQMPACAKLPVDHLPPELSVTKIGVSEAGTPYAPSPDGEWLALVRNGLRLQELKGSQQILLRPDTPVALAWNRSGDRLIAAFPDGQETDLHIFGINGEVTDRAVIDGTLSDMVWGSDNRITLATITRKKYSFGTTLFTKLWRWDIAVSPSLLAETSVTLKPRTVKLLEAQLDKTAKLSVSPLGDEILYTRLHDPPAVNPYMKILLRHLETGIEREAAQVDPTLGDAFLLEDDLILFSDGINETKLIDPWTGLTRQHYQREGRKLAVSATGQYILADGELFEDNKQIAVFSPSVGGIFSANGRLLLRYQDQLFLLSGLKKEKSSTLSEQSRLQMLKIRKWRSLGLITQQEFQLQKKRILAQ